MKRLDGWFAVKPVSISTEKPSFNDYSLTSVTAGDWAFKDSYLPISSPTKPASLQQGGKCPASFNYSHDNLKLSIVAQAAAQQLRQWE